MELLWIFLKFVENKVIFLHFPDLWKLVNYVDSISMPFLIQHESNWVYYLLLINFISSFKFMTDYLYFPNNLQDIKDHI